MNRAAAATRDFIQSLLNNTTARRMATRLRDIYRAVFTPRVVRVLGWGIQIVALGIVAYLVMSNWAALMTMHWEVKPLYLAAMTAGYAINFGMWALCWTGAISMAGPPDVRRDFRTYAYGNLVRRVPFLASAWQYVGKTLFYETHGFSRRQVLFTTMLDILAQAASISLVALLVMALDIGQNALHLIMQPALAVAGAAILMAFALALVLPEDLISGLAKFPSGWLHRARPRALAVFGLYALAWLLSGVIAWLFFNGTSAQFPLSLSVAMGYGAIAGLLSYIAYLIPLPLKGVSELSYAYLLSAHFGMSLAGVVALAFTLVIAALEVLFSIGIVSLTNSSPKNHQNV